MGMFDEEPKEQEAQTEASPPVEEPTTTPIVDPSTRWAEENAQLRGQVNQLTQQINQLMYSMQRPAAPVPIPEPEPEIDFSENPRAAIETLAERKARKLYESEVVPIIKQFQQTQQERAMADARAQYDAIRTDPTTAPFFDQYKGEFDDALRTLSEKDFSSLSRPGAVKQVFNFVLGQHIDTILKGSARPSGMSTTAPPVATKSVPRAAAKSQPSRLSDEEARMAASFGMSDEEWSKWANNPEGA